MNLPKEPSKQPVFPRVDSIDDFQSKFVDSQTVRVRRNASLDTYDSVEQIRFEGLKLIEKEFYTPTLYTDGGQIFLASVGKIAIAKLTKELFPNNQNITITKDQLQGIIKEIYRRTKENIDSGVKGQTPLEFAQTLESIQKYLSPDSISEQNEVSIDDLIELSLVISTNSTIPILRDLCKQKLAPNGSPDEQRRTLHSKIKETLPAMGVTTDADNNYIWVQYDPNTGLLSEMTNLLSSIVSEDPLLSEKMVNNPIDFKFDFTNSELGKELIKNGAQIIEKTGSYEMGVNWCANLADRGLPFHTPLLTVVTILKDGKQFSFGYYRAYELPFPSDKLEPYTEEMTIDGKVVTASFPNVYSDEFLNLYVPKFEELAYPDFRNNMMLEVGPYIEQIFGVKL